MPALNVKDYPEVEPWDTHELAFREWRSTGVFMSGQPFARYGNVSECGLLTSSSVSFQHEGQEHGFIGLLKLEEKMSAKGYRYARGFFSDANGDLPIFMSGKKFDAYRKYICPTIPIQVRAQVKVNSFVDDVEEGEEDRATVELTLLDVRTMLAFFRDNATRVTITPPNLAEKHIKALTATLEEHRGLSDVDLVMDLRPQVSWTYRLPQKVDVSDLLFSDIERIFGGAACAVAHYDDKPLPIGINHRETDADPFSPARKQGRRYPVPSPKCWVDQGRSQGGQVDDGHGHVLPRERAAAGGAQGDDV